MEEERQMKPSNQSEEINKLVETAFGSNEVSILEQESVLEDTNKEIARLESEKEAETKAKKQASSLKKPSAIPKSKPTVPKPFSLGMDRKMSRERQVGLEQAKETKPKPQLSKSISLNLKAKYRTSAGSGTEQISEIIRGTNSNARSTFVINGRTEKQIESETKPKKKIQGSEVESKKTQTSVKEEEDTQITKLKKSSTFKASPLPSFYHKRDIPSKPEIIKIPLTVPKSPRLGPRSKSFAKSDQETSTQAAETKASKMIRRSAKETINKLLKGTFKAPKVQPKEVKTSSSSSSSHGGKMGKEAASNVAVQG